MSSVPHAGVEIMGGGVALLGFSVSLQGGGDGGGVLVGVQSGGLGEGCVAVGAGVVVVDAAGGGGEHW